MSHYFTAAKLCLENLQKLISFSPGNTQILEIWWKVAKGRPRVTLQKQGSSNGHIPFRTAWWQGWSTGVVSPSWLPAPSASLPRPPLLLCAHGEAGWCWNAKPISILIIQKGDAKYCSHIVYENTQDIYYISGGRTGSLIASAGCKL